MVPLGPLVVVVLYVCRTGAAAAAVGGLTVDWQPSPSLGVSPVSPTFGWTVPGCEEGSDAIQTSYRIVVLTDGGATAWDSGNITSNRSVAVKYSGSPLAAGTAYRWWVSVASTTSNGRGCCSCAPFSEGLFITAFDWESSPAGWIGLGNSSSTFNLVRCVVRAPPGEQVQRAIAFVSAQNSWGGMEMNYRLYVNGQLASVGPGRGEATVAGIDAGRFRTQPYNTIDLTPLLPEEGGPVVLALQTMQFSGVNPNTGNYPFPCARGVECNGPTQISKGPAVLMHVDLHTHTSGTDSSAVTPWAVTQATGRWKVLDGDSWLRPQVRAQVCADPGCQEGSGTGRVEHTDARLEPVGWREHAAFDDSSWAPAVEISTSSLRKSELVARMAGAAVAVTHDVQPSRTTAVNLDHSSDVYEGYDSMFFVDFAKEFTGGLRLTVENGHAGQVISFRSGERCAPLTFDASAFGGIGQNVSEQCTSVEQMWGWQFNWTLREGSQVIEQHQYMIFRYLSVEFVGEPPPKNWSVSAWGVNAPFDPTESFFNSSDTVLNRVWALSSQMLEKGVLDTYTDSNARERRPYEADGLITAGNRMFLQSNNAMWSRHSHSWIFTFPTWPVEWLMITPFLAYMDYWQTGSADLADSFFELLYNNTQIHALDPYLGLVNTSKQGSRDVDLWNYTAANHYGGFYSCRVLGKCGGRHLIGWAPRWVDNNVTWMWSNSDFMSVSNFYTVRGLENLAELARAAGRTNDAAKCAKAAADLRSNITKHMWDHKHQRFCDGICSDVGGNHSIYSDMYALWLGIIPDENGAADAVWKSMTSWGMEHLGDLGMFVYMKALAAHAGDSGEAALQALTKCDDDSWCGEIRLHDATMTQEEAFSGDGGGGTMSHGWGASTIAGTLETVVGLRQTAPAFARFMVKPQLGGLERFSVKVPTPYGAIWVNASSSKAVDVGVPCNTRASLCLAINSETIGLQLALDGVAVEGEATLGHTHSCVHEVGCGAAGMARRLTWAQ